MANAPSEQEKALVERIVEESKTDETFRDEMRELAARARQQDAPRQRECLTHTGQGVVPDCRACTARGLLLDGDPVASLASLIDTVPKEEVDG